MIPNSVTTLQGCEVFKASDRTLEIWSTFMVVYTKPQPRTSEFKSRKCGWQRTRFLSFLSWESVKVAHLWFSVQWSQGSKACWEGLGYICAPARWCPFTTRWALQPPLLPVCCDPGGKACMRRRRGCLSAAPVCTGVLQAPHPGEHHWNNDFHQWIIVLGSQILNQI